MREGICPLPHLMSRKSLPRRNSPACRFRVGYEFIYSFPQPTPMILTVSIHYSRASDIVIPDHLTTNPSVPVTAYRDGFGNWCSRIVAPPGQISNQGQRGRKRYRLAGRRCSFRSAARG